MEKTTLLVILASLALVISVFNAYYIIGIGNKLDSAISKTAFVAGSGNNNPIGDSAVKETAPTGNSGSGSQKASASADDDAVLGNPNAPVTIIEFSDFQCPFCERFVTQTLPELKKAYIDTGKAKLIYRDFPLSFHQYAENAARAAEAAGEQGKYYEMHDKIFQNQSALDDASLKKYAQDLGLDMEKFNADFTSAKIAAEVKKDFSDGQGYGVTGTPTFFINGTELVGAQPFSAFQKIIDAELGKGGN